jgi:hypothetical protein
VLRGLPFLLCLITVGCSSTYRPRPTGSVAMVIEHGAVVHVKNGRRVPLQLLGEGLEDLIPETPAAAAHARTARTQLRVGVPAYVTGFGGVVVGILVLSGPPGWIVIGASTLVAGTGLVFMGSATTHLVDAVNIHNDSIEAGPGR